VFVGLLLGTLPIIPPPLDERADDNPSGSGPDDSNGPGPDAGPGSGPGPDDSRGPDPDDGPGPGPGDDGLGDAGGSSGDSLADPDAAAGPWSARQRDDDASADLMIAMMRRSRRR